MKSALLYALLLIAVIAGGIVLNAMLNPAQEDPSASWAAPQSVQAQSDAPTQAAGTDNKELSDHYVLIKGGSFMMGSPETENRRVEDETQHEVTVTDFYISPYESIKTQIFSKINNAAVWSNQTAAHFVIYNESCSATGSLPTEHKINA